MHNIAHHIICINIYAANTSAGGSVSLTVNYKIGIPYKKEPIIIITIRTGRSPGNKGPPAHVIYCKLCRFVGGSVLLLGILYYYYCYYIHG